MFEASHTSPIVRIEPCCITSVRRVAAMLDLPADGYREGQARPNGWHFFILGADTRRSELRRDGFPGFGLPMPELGLPRLLIVNRTVEYRETLPIGSQIRRVSSLKELKEKSAPSGPMAVVTFSHELFVNEQTGPALIETQTYVLQARLGPTKAPNSNPVSAGAMQMKTVIPDETLLFQYSALGFNSHRIHIDKAYARDVEGFPDLVVNGGLTTLLMTEFARLELGLTVTRVRMKNVAPLFCGRPITLTADCFENQWCVKAFDDAGILAAEMKVDVK
jgi:3-methylfumaryl-CoA hydratase